MKTSSEECEQAIFSWVEKKNVLGHQLVSFSPGVTREELKFLESWNLPLSIDNVNFTEGRRMFILPSGRICLNYLKNLGRDLKGRDGALLSHLIIMNTTTFLEMEGDFETSVPNNDSWVSFEDVEQDSINHDGEFSRVPQGCS